MGKIEFSKASYGMAKVKIDVEDSVYFDAKPAHVSIYYKGSEVVRHLILDEIDYLAVNKNWPTDVQEAFYLVRKYKRDIEDMYRKCNPGKK